MNSESSSTVILSMASSRSSWVMTAMVNLLVRATGTPVVISRFVECGREDASRGFGSRLLVANLAEDGPEVPDVRHEQAGQRRDRRLHPAGELPEQDLARGQRGQAPNAVGADRPIAEHGAGDRDLSE